MKAQTSQIFIFILAAVIMGLVVLFGYMAFSKITTSANEVAESQFLKNVRQDVDSVRRLRGTSEVFTYTIPGQATEICFTPVPSQSQYATIQSFSNTTNFFLMKGEFVVESLSLGPISTENDELCFLATRPAKVRMTGTGAETIVETG